MAKSRIMTKTRKDCQISKVWENSRNSGKKHFKIDKNAPKMPLLTLCPPELNA